MNIFKIKFLFVLFSLSFASISFAQVTEPALTVTQITNLKSFAIDDGAFEDGWQWKYSITVPAAETVVRFKFDDWSGVNSISPESNVRIYSAQSVNAFDSDHAKIIVSKTDFSGGIVLNQDLDADAPGRQVEIIVEMRVPTSTPAGSYSTNFSIKSDPPAPLTITADPVTKFFDYPDPTLTYKVTSGELSPGDSFSGNLMRDPGEDLGSYNIVQGNLDAGPAYIVTFVPALFKIVPAPAVVTLDHLVQTYSGYPIAAGYTVVPPGIRVDLYYFKIPVPYTHAGIYDVLAVVNDPYYFGSTTGKLTILKAQANVNIDQNSLTQVYDGNPKSVSFTTEPSNLKTSVSYNGTSTMPRDIGSYAVEVTVDDIDYEGFASTTLTISN